MDYPIINRAYQFYRTNTFFPTSKKKFINKIKIDNDFSSKWCLKIDEKSLSYKERWFGRKISQ